METYLTANSSRDYAKTIYFEEWVLHIITFEFSLLKPFENTQSNF